MHICIAAAAAKSLQLCHLRPHRWQPARLPRPWDSPGKNTGVGCHFLLQCVKVKSLSCVLVTPWTAAYWAPPSMGFSRREYWHGVPLPSPHICIMYMYYMNGMLPLCIKYISYCGFWQKSLTAAGLLEPAGNQCILLLVACGECHAPSQPLSTHR